MKTIKEYSTIVNEAIAAMTFTEPASLYDPIAYTMEGQGKRLRPVLTLAVADALNADIHKALSPALGIELYHNFTLLHDDIMDNSPTRRGRLAVWKKWTPAQAILSGDTMLSLAMGHIIKSDFPADTRIELIDCFNATAIEVDHGQQLDMDFETQRKVSLEDYLLMISQKTGALLGGACEIGAICGGASALSREAFRNYGYLLGLAFQIQDDILDVYGDEASLGKPIGGDIANDKHTWLHIHAGDEASDEMDDIYRRGLCGKEKYDAVRAIYDRLNLRQRGETTADGYLNNAINAIARAGLDDVAYRFFVDFAHSLIGRKK